MAIVHDPLVRMAAQTDQEKSEIYGGEKNHKNGTLVHFTAWMTVL
jgi:hypothetical protein